MQPFVFIGFIFYFLQLSIIVHISLQKDWSAASLIPYDANNCVHKV